MSNPILITGCARSGTSLTAGIIDNHGAFGGTTIAGGRDMNPKGFFENREIRENLVKPYLRIIGADPMGQHPLPEAHHLIPISNLRERVEEIITMQGYEDGPWYYKGAKMCLIWQIWHNAFPNAKWVIVRREDRDIVNSCMRTGFMRAYRQREGWQDWVDAHKRRFEEMKACPTLQCKEIHPSKFVDGDYSEVQEVMEWLGFEFDPQIVKDIVVPAKFRRQEEV